MAISRLASLQKTFRAGDTLLYLALFLLLVAGARAQTAQDKTAGVDQKACPPPARSHDEHDMSNMPGMNMKQDDQDMSNMPGMNMTGSSADSNAQMNMPTLFGGPSHSMNAIGSGTSILPESTHEPMLDWMHGNWMFMAHAYADLETNSQGGRRGVFRPIESHNWFMFGGEHPLGQGTFMARAMLTAEPFTTPAGGFPELFQTGETYKGRPIIDAQHPHNLFMELVAGYAFPLSSKTTFTIYGGPAGEPALGPTAFMHRPSAGDDPLVPISHHWQDSTHLSQGVVTSGISFSRFLKLEGSVFHGAEPGEDRTGLTVGALDSWSTRAWFIPASNWAVQMSYGRLTKPEALEPGDVIRTTASIAYNRPWSKKTDLASSLIWGRNRQEGAASNSYLAETALNFKGWNQVFARAELVDKTGLGQINIFDKPGLDSLDQAFLNQARRVGAFTLGGVRDFMQTSKMRAGLGAAVEFYHVPSDLVPAYGAHPVSFQLFLRVRLGR